MKLGRKIGISRSSIAVVVSITYLVLISILLVKGNIEERLQIIVLCCLNYALSLTLLVCNTNIKNKLYFYIIYFAFFLVYLVKGFVLILFDLRSMYIVTTIRTSIRPETYMSALNLVTTSHAILVFVSLILGLFAGRSRPLRETDNYWPRRRIFHSMLLIFLFVLLSSAVMWRFGVAAMGSEGVSLPYKLSGIFFYGRTLFIPILLLFFIERSIVCGGRYIFMLALGNYVLLAASDTIIRASKEPFITLALLLLTLTLLLSFNGSHRHRIVNRKTVFVMFGLGLLLFPIVEAYRAQRLEYSIDLISLISNISASSSDGNSAFLLHAVERFFHRLLGFTQMAGLIEFDYPSPGLFAILNSGGFSRFYTEFVLGFSFAGHLSSPSLIGACLLLGGEWFWPVPFALYITFMLFVWRSASRLRSFTFSVRAMLSFEILNTMMAGSIDTSIFRIFLIFSFCIGCETLVRAVSADQRRTAY